MLNSNIVQSACGKATQCEGIWASGLRRSARKDGGDRSRSSRVDIDGSCLGTRNAGILINFVVVRLLAGGGVGTAFVGLTQSILYDSAQVSTGRSFTFNSIISVLIGGVLLADGIVSVVGIVFGTITSAIVNQGIFYTGFDHNLGSLIIGAMIFLAVLMSNTLLMRAMSYSAAKSFRAAEHPPNF